MSTTEDQMEVAESEDSGVATGSDTMSTSSAASTATLVASPPPSVDGDLGTFDSGLLSPTSVTSSTQWSNSGYQHHVTGNIRSDDPSHHGHPNAAHSGLSSDSGFFSGTARPGVTDSAQKTQDWIEKHFEVFVKNLDGKTLTIPVERDEDVAKFRAKVDQKTGVPGSQQYLTSAEGRKLEDGKRLCDYNIKKHSTIYCQGRLRGG
ncbi:uncharacterized protein LOC131934926 [Physella acuta]|uniref:uncharacterized protein LOC131934926 n=1 Tax=Physella acuta TaxID=109671 RepID=UPI0027DC0497|nr:uncharacterized protein LOC131934926 [Physella acuta]